MALLLGYNRRSMRESLPLLVERLLDWYAANRRDLAWRPARGAAPGTRPDPYRVLVSEAMLQQTQVATVIGYFERFMARFPTLMTLAAADEQAVLRAWQGLGYYSRARNLLATARVVVRELGGELPKDVAGLMKLPGVGRYTAGAIVSIAFGELAPVLDGNVARVICRLDAIRSDPRARVTVERLWKRAEELLPRGELAPLVGDFNSALMELGAIICTPRKPKCGVCPVRGCCSAAARGLAERIPAPRVSKATPFLSRTIFCVWRGRGSGRRWLIEQRPAKGRWAGMWQFPTREADGAAERRLGAWRHMGTIRHALTHRRYGFEVYLGEEELIPPAVTARPSRWVRLGELDRFPMPKPQLSALAMIRAGRRASGSKAVAMPGRC